MTRQNQEGLRCEQVTSQSDIDRVLRKTFARNSYSVRLVIRSVVSSSCSCEKPTGLGETLQPTLAGGNPTASLVEVRLSHGGIRGFRVHPMACRNVVTHYIVAAKKDGLLKPLPPSVCRLSTPTSLPLPSLNLASSSLPPISPPLFFITAIPIQASHPQRLCFVTAKMEGKPPGVRLVPARLFREIRNTSPALLQRQRGKLRRP